MEGIVVMHRIVRHHVEGDGTLFLKIEIAMHLLDMRIALQKSHHTLLQLTLLAMVANCIDAHSDNDMIFIVEQFGDGPGEGMDTFGRHRFGHADVERADDGVGTIVVEDDIIDAEHPGILHHVLHDVMHHVLRNALAEKLAHRSPNHLDARLDDDERDDGSEDAVEVDSREEHDAGGDERGERHHGIEGRIGATGLQGVALQPRTLLFFTYQPKTIFTTIATMMMVSVTAV